MSKICASCTRELRAGTPTGVSSLYHPEGGDILLCEACFLSEDMLIEHEGKNNLPEVLRIYYTNLGWELPPRLQPKSENEQN